jgi:polysaccharide biosynthesis protein PelA
MLKFNRNTLLPIIILLMNITINYSANASNSDEYWVAYYSDKAPISAFRKFSLIVLDSDTYDKLVLESLIDNSKTVLGYISLGEIENSRWFYDKFKNSGLLLQENKNWKGSYFVDVRNPKWTKFVINYLVPSVIQKGFSGIFMDTLDNPGYLENLDPVKYKGMRTAAINLVKAIRLHYPKIKIMMNRGYDLLPKLVDDIDYELGECVYSDYNFSTKKYGKVEKDTYATQVKILQNAKKENPNLKIFTLDYWDKNDKKEINNIYKIERDNGFIPYVATISLDEIIQI